MSGFTKPTRTQLKHYVYRLIDPRNGETFYVGRGQDNRVFAHVSAALERSDGQLKPHDEDDNPRLERIRAIRRPGLEPLHIIHRHGMDEDVAKEVEAALIDAYPGLTNMVRGAGSDYGPADATQLERLYGAQEIEFSPGDLCMVIKTRWSTVDDHGSIYEAVRRSWVVSKKRADRAKYVLAVIDGLCEGVFVPDSWMPSGTRPPSKPQRYEFTGRPTDEEISRKYIGRRLPAEMRKRGTANPVRYSYRGRCPPGGRGGACRTSPS